MSSMRLHIIPAVVAAVSLAALASCDLRTLYVEGRSGIDVVVRVDWTQLGGDPEGATICFYPEDKDQSSYVFRTNAVTRTIVSVPSGYYTVMVFNRTASEFGSMTIKDENDISWARAELESKLFSWLGRSDTLGRTVYEPEEIVVGRTDHFYVRKVSEHHFSDYAGSNGGGSSFADALDSTDDIDSVMVCPKRVVYSASILLDIEGIQNITSVSGYITGMSGEMYLAGCTSGDDVVTHVPDTWKLVRSESDYTKGTLSGSFSCFGLPQQYLFSREESNNTLLLKFDLRDGTTVFQTVKRVGCQIEQDDDELTVTIEDHDAVVIPDVEAEGGGQSGFDVSFDDWAEDPIDIPVGI